MDASSRWNGGKKTVCGACGRSSRTFYDRKQRRVRDLSCGDARVYVQFEIRRVACRSCQAVKQEKFDWLADNPFYTKGFAFYVGQRCRSAPIAEIARELKLDWKTVKELDKQYLREQLRRAPAPQPRAIGIDEISIRKGHTYRIVVSDLERKVPIWFGGADRIELAVMDMWPAFRMATLRRAPRAAILYDKFHIMRHLGKALDEVRKAEYRRAASATHGRARPNFTHSFRRRPKGRRGQHRLLDDRRR